MFAGWRYSLLQALPSLLVACLCYMTSQHGAAELNHVHPHRFDGDQVVRVPVRDLAQWTLVQDILHKCLSEQEIDIWCMPSEAHMSADIFLPGYVINQWSRDMTSHGLAFTVIIENVQALIDKEMPAAPLKERHRRSVLDDIVGTYPTLEEVQEWQDAVAEVYGDQVNVSSIGQTYDGRDLIVMKLGKPGANKPAVWMDAGVHAREWVSPATAIYIITQLLNAEGDSELEKFLTSFDWYFLVIANPDGYAFTHTDYRLWRKNRKPLQNTACIGVDLNRNWNFNWGGVSSSSNMCSEVYRGPSPSSELEVQHMERFIKERSDVIKAYMSLHAYTMSWLTRWAYSKQAVTHDHDYMLNLSQRAVEAINAVHGQTYAAGNAGTLLYEFAGGSADWARGVANITYSFLLELRDNGTYGFVLPVEQALPTAQEAWEGIKVLVRELIDVYVPEVTSTPEMTAPPTKMASQTKMTSHPAEMTSPPMEMTSADSQSSSTTLSSTTHAVFDPVHVTVKPILRRPAGLAHTTYFNKYLHVSVLITLYLSHLHEHIIHYFIL